MSCDDLNLWFFFFGIEQWMISNNHLMKDMTRIPHLQNRCKFNCLYVWLTDLKKHGWGSIQILYFFLVRKWLFGSLRRSWNINLIQFPAGFVHLTEYFRSEYVCVCVCVLQFTSIDLILFVTEGNILFIYFNMVSWTIT